VAEKNEQNQIVKRRSPRQERALGKIQLILEAASRILDKDGVEALTTNRMAEVAGVSIGTIYQYFDDKKSILDALAEQELQAMSDAVMAALQGSAPVTPGDRIRAVVRAVMNAYGGRTRVHRLLMQHVLARGKGSPVPGMLEAIKSMSSRDGIVDAGQRAHTLSETDAFVLTHAFGGIMRGMFSSSNPPPVQEVEDALVQLMLRYMSRQ
jgi:AcrR family transcriptional regulator